MPSTTAGMFMYCIRIDGKHLTFLPDGQRREDNTRPPLHQPQFQSSASGPSRNDNRDSFNFNHNQVDNAYNDNSETHCKFESMQSPKSLFEIRDYPSSLWTYTSRQSKS